MDDYGIYYLTRSSDPEWTYLTDAPSVEQAKRVMTGFREAAYREHGVRIYAARALKGWTAASIPIETPVRAFKI